MDRPPVGSVEDLATLAQLDENILLEELKARYNEDKIYTYVGDILVAVNPYKRLDIYSKEFSEKYNRIHRASIPPHIFAIADATYRKLLMASGSEPKDQCVLISGESGAGKTESTKLIIRQIIELSQGHSLLEQQILQCNPILEAFGNAQTLMNDNSSRFGRYIQLKFKGPKVIGSKINEYLLEKSRLVHQGRGEQNFHIFYLMFAGLPAEVLQTYQLGDPSTYSYLNNGPGHLMDDTKGLVGRYEELISALDIVGFNDEEQDEMFMLLSGALNMGNIDFSENDGGDAKINSPNQADAVAKLLGLDPSELKGLLTSSTTFVRGQELTRKYNLPKAIDSRDAIAKALYSRLFGWIINKVNQLLAPTESMNSQNAAEIGILDIFGFENFDDNSFEQNCINLANEQLQFFFNKHIFMLEQEEYEREGVDWREIKFIDNKGILDLFLTRPIGLLSLLDEECIVPNGSDLSLVQKLNENFTNSPYFVKSPHGGMIFAIKHYAGEVKYNAKGWLEKNRDTVPSGVNEMLQQSQNRLLGMIFKGRITRTGTLALQGIEAEATITRRAAKSTNRSAKERKLTVSTQFKTSLQVMMEKMTSADPVFIRCIKPNTRKAPGQFADDFVQAQLLYTGVLETTKIRREGFAVRPTFADFVNKYKAIARNLAMPATSDSCQGILQCSKVSGWHIGKTKVFLKYWHVERLNELLEELGKYVIFIQRGVRAFLARLRVKRMRAEAENKAREACILMTEVEEVGQKIHNTQLECAKDDKKISKSFFKKAPVEPPPVILSAQTPIVPQSGGGSKAPPLPEVPPLDDGDEDTFKRPEGEKPDRERSLRWFKEHQLNQVKQAPGVFAEWFHGIITRKEAERLLEDKPTGCFLIRVGQSRFGYSLTFKAEDRCRHYIIDQTYSGKYLILGEQRAHKSLHDLINYHRKVHLSNWPRTLGEPCGQEEGQCDYYDLVLDEDRLHINRPPRKQSISTPDDMYMTALPAPIAQSPWDAFDQVKISLTGKYFKGAKEQWSNDGIPGPHAPPPPDIPPVLPERTWRRHVEKSLPPLPSSDEDRNQYSTFRSSAAIDRKVKLSTTRQRTIKSPKS